VQQNTEQSMFGRAQAGDDDAREQLAQRYLPLARAAARRYFNTRAEPDDLFQVACYGLVKAIDGFDPARGHSFSSFAVPTMSGELKRHFRSSGWATHVPRSLQELSLRVEAAVDDLEPTLGRSPSPREIASYLRVETEQVVEALGVAASRESRPLERTDGGDGEVRERIEVGVDEPGYESIDALVSIAPAYMELSERDRRILSLRFCHEMTQSEIAKQLGISQMHVSRLIRRSLDELRQRVGAA
jgi:RNA polymerase sigma-B factor